MRVPTRWVRLRAALAVILVAAAFRSGSARGNEAGGAGARAGEHPRRAERAHAPLARAAFEPSSATDATNAASPSRKKRVCVVAVQPIAGNSGQVVRVAVTRIMREHGYRTLTSLPAYEGTGQYPGLAREHNVRAFVTADLEERGGRSALTFLVWSGISGSVVGRWSVAAPRPELVSAIGRGFWHNLGSAVVRAKAPPSSELDEAPPVRIDAEVDAAGARPPISRN